MMGVHGTSALCPSCDTEVVGAMKEEPSGWKVYAECRECGTDFGRVGFVTRSNIDHVDEAHEQAVEIIDNATLGKYY